GGWRTGNRGTSRRRTTRGRTRSSACGGRTCGTSGSAAAGLERDTLAWLTDYGPVSAPSAAARAPTATGDRRRRRAHDARGGRRGAAGACGRRRGQRSVEVALPDDVAGVVVDRIDVVRAAGDDRHRHEQRDAIRADALEESIQLTWT